MATEVRIQVKTRLSSDLKGTHLIISKFHEACERLDPSIFEPFIREDDIFVDEGKYEFLYTLKERFDEIRTYYGLERLTRQPGKCMHCHPGAELTEYFDPDSGTVVAAYFFEIAEGQLTGIFECHASSGYCEQNPFALQERASDEPF